MGRHRNKQLCIYPDPTAAAIVGGATSACNRAVQCWADVLRRSMPDLTRAEWNFAADVLNGTWLLDASHWTSSTLAAEFHDAQQLNGTGDRWFGEELDRGSGQAATDALIAKVQAMTWEQVQYVLTAVTFFWEHTGIDHQADEWWTIEYRVRLLREPAERAVAKKPARKRSKK